MDRYQGKDIINRWRDMKSSRANWETLWQDISDWMLTRKGGIITTIVKGEQRTREIFDTTAKDAGDRLAAGLLSYLAPPNKQWFELTPKDSGLSRDFDVKRWFSEISRRTHFALSDSNFNQEIHEFFIDLVFFCTANIYVEPGVSKWLNFQSFPISDYCILESASGRIDTIYRKFEYTARQALQAFNESDLPKKILDAAAGKGGKQPDEKFNFLHAVFPRSDKQYRNISNVNMEYASLYVEMESENLVRESGYNTMPYLVARFNKANDEMYGRGPGTDKLPEVRMLNAMARTMLLAAEKNADPPMLIPNDGSIGRIRTYPGGIIPWDTSDPLNEPKPLKTTANVNLSLEMLAGVRESINTAFFMDLFQMLAARDQRMTATEVEERIEEKLVIFAPMLSRLQSELFDPMISRVVTILAESGVYPPAPSQLRDSDYDIVYVSKIATARKVSDTTATGRTLEFVLPLTQMDQSIADNFDMDAIARGTADNYGVPAEFLRSPRAREAMRAQRAQALAQQQAIEQAGEISQAASRLRYKSEEGSPLKDIQESMTA